MSLKYRICPACNSKSPLVQPLCPQCGYDFIAKKRRPQNDSVDRRLQILRGLGILLVLLVVGRLVWWLAQPDEQSSRAETVAVQPAVETSTPSVVREPEPSALHPVLFEFLALHNLEKVDERDGNRNTIAHHAALADRVDVMELGLEYGVDIDIANNAGMTPLALSILGGNTNVFVWLMGRPLKFDLPLDQGETPLHVAARREFVDGLAMLVKAGVDINARDAGGYTPLHAAVRAGRTVAVEWLLGNGAAVDVADGSGMTPLHTACVRGQSGLAELLLDHGADVLRSADDGNTPLHIALARDNTELARLLLARGGSSVAAGRHGVTPLHIAVYMDMAELVASMLNPDIDVNVRDADGYTPMDYALINDNKPLGLLLRNTGGRSVIIIQAACEYCRGGRVCHVCRGNRHVSCTQCMGTGTGRRETSQKTCVRCKGSGTVAGIGTAKIRCSGCKGSGRVAATQTAPCTQCQGKGHVTCSECTGTGVCRHCSDNSQQAALEDARERAVGLIRRSMQTFGVSEPDK